jgi:hypothetical protein
MHHRKRGPIFWNAIDRSIIRLQEKRRKSRQESKRLHAITQWQRPERIKAHIIESAPAGMLFIPPGPPAVVSHLGSVEKRVGSADL